MISTSLLRTAMVSGAALAVGLSVLTVSVTRADTPDQRSFMDGGDSHFGHGKIVGWPGGDAVIYPTLGFFGNAQIFAVGAVEPDGSFSIELPRVVRPARQEHRSVLDNSVLRPGGALQFYRQLHAVPAWQADRRHALRLVARLRVVHVLPRRRHTHWPALR